MSSDGPQFRPLDDTSVQRASRVFEHRKCKRTTQVLGQDLLRLECPFLRVRGMHCAGCQRQVGLHEIFWADTGEMIWEYRRRIAFSVPFWRRLYLGIISSTYEAALNLRQDEQGRIVRPLDPPDNSPSPRS